MPSPRAGSARAAWAGCLAVLLAIGASELAAGLLGRGPSILGAVGQTVILRTPQAVEDFVVGWFGLYDKLFLVCLMTLICAGLGALVGITRRFGVAVVAFALFAVAGAFAAHVDPLATPLGMIVPPLVGAAVGLTTLRRLMASASAPDGERRAFLRAAAAVSALAALSAASGRWLLTRVGTPMNLSLPKTGPPPPIPANAQVAGATRIVTPNRDFYRIDILLDPLQVPLDSWRLRIEGLVEAPFELTYDELVKLPMTQRYVTLTCVSNEVGGELVGNALWMGVPLADLLARARVKPQADFLASRSVDGFVVGCDLAVLGDGRTSLVAIGMNGDVLPVEHGFPARLVISGLYGYVSATKWVRTIELTTRAAFASVANARGLSTQNEIKTESRIDTPQARQTVASGTVTVAGVAWAQNRGVSRVEVQVDEGPWQEATLAAAMSKDTWREWQWPWPASPGAHILRVRATDGAGHTQTAERQRPAQGGATGWHTIEVTVA